MARGPSGRPSHRSPSRHRQENSQNPPRPGTPPGYERADSYSTKQDNDSKLEELERRIKTIESRLHLIRLPRYGTRQRKLSRRVNAAEDLLVATLLSQELTELDPAWKPSLQVREIWEGAATTRLHVSEQSQNESQVTDCSSPESRSGAAKPSISSVNNASLSGVTLGNMNGPILGQASELRQFDPNRHAPQWREVQNYRQLPRNQQGMSQSLSQNYNRQLTDPIKNSPQRNLTSSPSKPPDWQENPHTPGKRIVLQPPRSANNHHSLERAQLSSGAQQRLIMHPGNLRGRTHFIPNQMGGRAGFLRGRGGSQGRIWHGDLGRYRRPWGRGGGYQYQR